ncbi:MAG TPA: hypothetical protein VHC22_12695 [Pirellulales bacterium]|nr:hypothetical protein [Pirellulales bacterium]
MDPSREAIARDLPGGLDLDRRRNYFQLAAGALAAACGAVIGFCTADKWSGLAATLGAFLGFVAGIFLAGFVLMFQPASKISVEAAITKHRNLKQRSRHWIGAWVLIVASGGLVIPWFGNDDRPWAFVLCVVWLCTVTGLGAFLKARNAALNKFGKEIEGRQPEQHV